MPPKGVQVLAQCTNRQQAAFLASQYRVEQPQLDDVEWLGEVPMVLRVRKTPTYWNVEIWPRSLLQGHDDVDFP